MSRHLVMAFALFSFAGYPLHAHAAPVGCEALKNLSLPRQSCSVPAWISVGSTPLPPPMPSHAGLFWLPAPHWTSGTTQLPLTLVKLVPYAA